MFETVTVKQALVKGQRMVNLPVLGILLGGCCLLGYLAYLFQNFAAIISLGGIVIVFGGAWIYWSVAIAKWKVWAFDNVRNVHDLKRKAIQGQLIWPDGSWFSKTEIWSRANREKWESLQVKFNKPDVFEEDFNVPAETVIGFSKKKLLGDVIALALLMAGVVYLLLETNRFIWGWVCLLGAPLYFVIDTRKKLKDKGPQIVINNDGIKTEHLPFFAWDEIFNDEINLERNGQHTNVYLEYRHPTGYAKMDISALNISKGDLENLLRTYRKRFEGRKKQQITT